MVLGTLVVATMAEGPYGGGGFGHGGGYGHGHGHPVVKKAVDYYVSSNPWILIGGSFVPDFLDL